MRPDAAPAIRVAGEAGALAVRPSVAVAPQDTPADNAWVEAVYETHARELWAMLYASCSDPDLAGEALQESFLRLHGQNPSGLRDVKAWLIRVGRNWLRDVARRRRHAARPSGFLDEFAEVSGDPLGRMEAKETQAQVRACLTRMREEDRQALVLRYALNWSSARMAEVLGSSPTAIDMRLSRARKRLAELLKDEGAPIPGAT